MLSSFDVAVIQVFLIALVAIYFYATYYAFGIRRTFSVGLSRRQALGVGLVATDFGLSFLNLLILSFIEPGSFLSSNPGPTVGLLYSSQFLVLFYWVDSSALAARRSDPLLRDILHWSRARLVLRPLIYVSGALVVVAGLFIASFPPILVPPEVIEGFGPVILGIILLPLAARRTGDLMLKKQLYWFGLFVLLYIVGDVVAIAPMLFQTFLIGSIVMFISGYCLYRSAKSLVPLYSFSQDIPQQQKPS